MKQEQNLHYYSLFGAAFHVVVLSLNHIFYSNTILAKVLPMIVLILLAIAENMRGAKNQAIVLGLIFSSFGDALLGATDLWKVDYFIHGLLAFLVAHLFYIYHYYNKLKQPLSKFPLPGLVMACYYIGIMLQLFPNVESDLKVPVVIYGAIITSLGWIALSRSLESSRFDKKNALAAIGVLSFIASDSSLAIHKFSFAYPHSHEIIMGTYYLAQLCIFLSECFETF